MSYIRKGLFVINETTETTETNEKRKIILIKKQNKSKRLTSRSYRRWAMRQGSLLHYNCHIIRMKIISDRYYNRIK